MGKRGNKRGRGRGGQRGGGSRQYHNRGESFNNIPRKNELFEEYYTKINPLVSSEESDEFWKFMRTDLPNSFRFTGSKGHAVVVQQDMKDVYFPKIATATVHGENVDPPRPVPWFPEQLAYTMTTPKQVTRKHPALASFQKFLVSETSIGNISRQEIVSMIPPLFMDVKPGMTVLDLCAAPGSKTAQLIEMLHAGEEARVRKAVRKAVTDREVSPDGREIDIESKQAETKDDWEDNGRATGLLIANDVEFRRAHMLVHQTKRLNSPNIIVTNHDASLFPSIEIPAEPGKTQKQYLKFDRILADVPCSGDGTCRKNMGIWKDWRPGNGLGLHAMQARILVRALQMLKVGGRVVYSTCSLNPVENEAVVASAIDRCGGHSNVRIVDCSNELAGLRRRNGHTQWKIMDKSGKSWESWAEVAYAKDKGNDQIANLSDTMFPPALEDAQSHLRNCIRVYPHDQDTGGFFITVLEKLSEIKARPEALPKKARPDVSSEKQNGETTQSPSVGKRELEVEHEETASKKLKTNHNATAEVQDQQNKSTAAISKGTTQNGTANNAPVGQIKPDTVVAMEVTESADAAQIAPSTSAAIETSPKQNLPPKPQESFKKKGGKQPQEEVFTYMDPDSPIIQSIFDFYKVHDSFPRDRFMVRNPAGEPSKAIYYTTALARDILKQMEGKGMKFVHCGVKMFVKQDVQGQDTCPWRIQSDGLPIVEPWVGEDRIVRLYSRKTLHKLLLEMFPRVANEGWKDLNEIGERILNIKMGCCILRVEPSEGEEEFKDRMVMPLWRGVSSVNLMLPKEERRALLLRLYQDESELIDYNKEDRMKAKEKVESKAPEAPPPEDVEAGKAEDAVEEEENADAPPPADNEEDNEKGGVPLPEGTEA